MDSKLIHFKPHHVQLLIRAYSIIMILFLDTTDMQDTFGFARPPEIIKAIQLYNTSFYGAMLFNLYNEEVGKIFCCWNTAVKLTLRLPRNTPVYFVENILTGYIPSL